ncbi:MAG: FAD-binding oxidoreductase [Wenzhouxiangella sp.]|nr:FAD-binding oxidoreductase [Wenzhouxiangella sp.]
MIRADLAVVGAGPVGLSTALALSESGLSCTVISAAPEGLEQLPPAGVEVTAPSLSWAQPQLVSRLQARSRRLWIDWMVRLAQETGVDLGYVRIGLLAIGAEAERGLRAEDSAWQPVAPQSCESRLAGVDGPGLFRPDFSQVRHDRLVHALELALRRRDVEVLDDSHACQLVVTGNVVPEVLLADGSVVSADAVVLAAEDRLAGLLYESGLDPLDLPQGRAHYLLFNPGSRLLDHVVVSPELCLVPQPDGRLLAIDRLPAASVSDGDALDELLTRVVNHLPALNRFDLQRHWLGPLPGVAGGRPMLGPYPHLRNLWINAGHYRNGLDIAPALAELLAEHFQGGPGLPGLAVAIRPD